MLQAGLAKIVLKPDPVKMVGSVHMPDKVKEQAPRGIVVDIGRPSEEGQTVPPIGPGDTVYCGSYAVVLHNGVEYWVIEYYDVLGFERLHTVDKTKKAG